jgi:hypothetical protein
MVGNLTEHLTHWVEQTGTWGAGLYILVYLVTTLALLPTTPLNLTAGLLFGPGWGLLWSVVGALLAAVVGFALARGVGQGWVKRRLGRHWGRLPKHLHRRGGVGALLGAPPADFPLRFGELWGGAGGHLLAGLPGYFGAGHGGGGGTGGVAGEWPPNRGQWVVGAGFGPGRTALVGGAGMVTPLNPGRGALQHPHVWCNNKANFSRS